MSNEKVILQIPLKGLVLEAFDVVFEKSGLENKSDYVRGLIMREYNVQNKDKK